MKKVCNNCEETNIAYGFKKTTMEKQTFSGLGWTRDEIRWVNSYWCSKCLLEYSTTQIKPRWNKKMQPLRDTNIQMYHKVQDNPKFIPAVFEVWYDRMPIPYFSRK